AAKLNRRAFLRTAATVSATCSEWVFRIGGDCTSAVLHTVHQPRTKGKRFTRSSDSPQCPIVRLPHRNQLFGGRRVDGDAVVELGLGGAHLDGHPKPLQDLVCAVADHVQPHHFLLLARADQLHGALHLALSHAVVHRREAAALTGSAHLDVLGAVVGARLGLGHAHRPDGRVAKDHRRDVGVHEPRVRLVVEQPLGEPPAGRDGHGRQQPLAADVAERVHPVAARVLESIHLDVPRLVQHDARPVQADVDRRLPADGPEQTVNVLDLDTRRRLHAEQRATLRDARHSAVFLEVDAFGGHVLHQRRAQHRVEGSEDLIGAHHNGHRGAERVKHTGELDGDVAGPHDDRLLWNGGELEETVAGDAVFGTRDIGNDRVAAGCDEHVIGREGVGADANSLRGREASRAPDDLHVAFNQVRLVDAVQAHDVLVPLCLELGPVDGGGGGDGEAVVFVVFDEFGVAGGVVAQLLGHAADVDASAAEGAVLDEGHLSTVLGGTSGARDAARAAADDEVVEVSGRAGHGPGAQRTPDAVAASEETAQQPH
ncbi:unnamed protein product, partial [Ixodes persulcatus]